MLTIWVGGVSLALAVAAFVMFVLTTLMRRPDGGAPPVGHAAVDATGWAKLLEAGAKVIDAFRKAGPSISALLASIIFVGIALYAAQHIPAKSEEKTPRRPEKVTSERCVVSGFVGGEHRIPMPGDPHAALLLNQDPQNCIASVVSHLKKDVPIMVMVTGRVDRRELRGSGRATYGTNFNLAYQRAIEIKSYVLTRYEQKAESATSLPVTSEELALRITTIGAGPANIDHDVSSTSMSEDRCVEILSLWNNPK